MYKIDTHVHTSEISPCARIDGKILVHLYKNAGYDGIVITDHYTSDYFSRLGDMLWKEKIDTFLQGYRNAFNEGRRIGLNVILGIELRFDENDNDYLIYGIKEEFLKDNTELYKYTLKTFWEFTRNKSMLIYQAHPYRSCVSPANPAYLDGVETFNGSPRYNSENHRALSFAKDNNLEMLSGSDFHERRDLSTGGIITYELPKDSYEFVHLLKNERIIRFLPEETQIIYS